MAHASSRYVIGYSIEMIHHPFFQAGHIEGFQQGYKRSAGSAAPAITVKPHLYSDEIDKRFGQHIWTEYCAGTDSEGYETEVTIPVEASDNLCGDPTLYVCGRDGILLDEIEIVLPQINALLSSPIVQAARERYRRQIVAVEAA